MGYLPSEKNTRIFQRWHDRARRRTIQEMEIEGDEGSKAHSKGGRIGNALPLMVGGSKARSKRNEVRA